MKLSRQDFAWAASTGLITQDQAHSLWEAFQQRTQSRASFDPANVAYYFGALVVIGAMGWFMTLAWERFGGFGIFLIAGLYALVLAWVGQSLWRKEMFKIPGGLLVTIAVCMTPLAIYGLERAFGIWPQGDPGTYRDYHIWVKGSWFLMEVGTIAAGLVALKFVRFPFLTAPIAYSLWYMSMDLTPLVFGRTEFSWDERLTVSLWFGLGMLVATYFIDRRTKEDYAFWGYLFRVSKCVYRYLHDKNRMDTKWYPGVFSRSGGLVLEDHQLVGAQGIGWQTSQSEAPKWRLIALINSWARFTTSRASSALMSAGAS